MLEEVQAWQARPLDRFNPVIYLDALAREAAFFDFPPEIRRVIYTTNAVESIQAQLRNVTRKRGAFPNEESLVKVLYLVLMKAQERWTMPIREWRPALYHFRSLPGSRTAVSEAAI